MVIPRYSLGEFMPLLRAFPTEFQVFKQPRCAQLFLFLLVKAYTITSDSPGGAKFIRRKGTYKCSISEIEIFFDNKISRNNINYTLKLLKDAGYIYYSGFNKNASTVFEIRNYEQYSLDNIAYSKCAWFPFYKKCISLPFFKQDYTCRVYLSLMSRIVNVERIEEISIVDIAAETKLSVERTQKCLLELMKEQIIVYKKKNKDTFIAIPYNKGLRKPAENAITREKLLKNFSTTSDKSRNLKLQDGNLNEKLCVSDSCEGSRQTLEQLLNNSETVDSTGTNESAELKASGYYLRDRDIDKYINNNNNNMCACAKENLLADKSWLATAMSLLGIQDTKHLLASIDRFFKEVEGNGDVHQYLSEYKRHFLAWYRKEQKRLQSERGAVQATQSQADSKSSGWEYKPLTKEEQELKDARERLRLQSFIEISKDKSNPSAKSCIFELTDKYNDGTLKRLGIDWKPPE